MAARGFGRRVLAPSAVVGLIGILGGFSAGAAAQGVADASCAPLSGANAFTIGNNRLAQTFTAGISGELTAAEISLGMSMVDVPADFTVRIGEVNGSGVPTNTVLASTTIPSASVPGGSSNLKVIAGFAQPAAIVAGQQYALVVSKPGAGTSIRAEVRGGPPADCPGSLFLSIGQTGSFADLGGDLVFTTFVTEPTAQDQVSPETTITKGPKAKSKKKKATFEFTGTDARAVASFECSLNGAPFTSCTSPLSVKGKKGKNAFSVRTKDAAGNVDATPATFDWKVKKKKK